jgi:hypothetical protein
LSSGHRLNRRRFLSASALALTGVLAERASARPPAREPINPRLLRRALAAAERHGDRASRRDFMGIADFSLASRVPRFHVLDLADGNVSSHLVAHGRGSDPAHTGWLERFSNELHSHATSSGTYLTDELYEGEHGRSLRLDGLDASNDNAAARAIVVHGAWYVSDEMVARFGVLGRSEGCFAFAQSSLAEILTKLGPGRLIYADKV